LSEINSDKFEVEYKINTDANFKVLGSINAAGNSVDTKNYQFNFLMESAVVYECRLKMINRDGTFGYSEIRTLSCADTKAEIAIAPNPATSVCQITGMLKGKNIVRILSNDGKIVNEINVVNNKDIDVSHLASGIYFVKIINENGTSVVERLVKY
jgi:Secretion system C-terminal sorting domain